MLRDQWLLTSKLQRWWQAAGTLISQLLRARILGNVQQLKQLNIRIAGRNDKLRGEEGVWQCFPAKNLIRLVGTNLKTATIYSL
jgi:hypothetical protein